MRTALLLTALAVPLAARAQEPVFVTPPVTMYQAGGVVGLDVERHARTTLVSSEGAFGLLPSWTLALRSVAAEAPGIPPAPEPYSGPYAPQVYLGPNGSYSGDQSSTARNHLAR